MEKRRGWGQFLKTASFLHSASISQLAQALTFDDAAVEMTLVVRDQAPSFRLECHRARSLSDSLRLTQWTIPRHFD